MTATAIAFVAAETSLEEHPDEFKNAFGTFGAEAITEWMKE